MRDAIRNLVEGRWFQNGVVALIIFNAVILGVDTLEAVKGSGLRSVFVLLDRAIIYAFTIEVGLRLYAHRREYFNNGWNVFDFVIVLVSLIAASSGLAAIRAFRVLRVLRVVTVIPRMRVVVSGLLGAIPGIASVGVLVVIIIYVFAVIAANLYGAAHPDLFGDVFASMYTLFQVMTLEGWPDVADAVRETHPRSWVFFVSFLLVGTFTMLNLFIAIVVRAVEEEQDTQINLLLEQNRAMQGELAEIRAVLARLEGGPRR